MSVPLYADDSYLREFDARVVRMGPGFVVLDRTAFYPKSGGQPSDTGHLRHGSSMVVVLKVLRRGSDIFHYIDGALQVGVAVRGVIDWDHRFLSMRRHSAEHLLSGLFERVEAGPKVYSDLTRLEFRPSDLTEDRLRQVEEGFKEAVEADILISTHYMAREELDVVGDERKRAFLRKIPRGIDMLRMVEIPGYNVTFCFGTHVRRTGEIGRLAGLELVKGRKGRRVVLFMLD